MPNLPSVQVPQFLVLGSFIQACCWRVARLPRAGESLQATGFQIELGGKGLNVAIGIARLSTRRVVDIVLGVGRDAPAQQVRQLLLDEGIGIEYVYSLADQSGCGSGHIGSDGANAIAVFSGPNTLLTAQHAELLHTRIAAADLVYAQFETSYPLIARVFELAKQTQSGRVPLTVLNPSPWQYLTPELLQWVDVLLVNATEANALLGLSLALEALTLAAAADRMASAVSALWRRWPAARTRHLIVTLGPVGCVYFSCGGECVAMPSFLVRSVVDTVGCGDAFASALCVGLARRDPWDSILRQANACGAMVAARLGVLSALPTAEAVRQFTATTRSAP